MAKHLPNRDWNGPLCKEPGEHLLYGPKDCQECAALLQGLLDLAHDAAAGKPVQVLAERILGYGVKK